MITLRIEHKISNYDHWKKAFDSDPIGRKQSGVKKYRIFHSKEDENFVAIDLDFDHLENARTVLIALQKIFPAIEGNLIFGARLIIFDQVETVDLQT